MSDAVRQGGGGSPAAKIRSRPAWSVRAVRACAGLVALWLVTPAHAGGLFRCTGATGETVYSSTTAGYQNCQRMASVPDAPARRKPVRPPAAPAAAPAPSLAGVKGSVTTTAQPLPPGSVASLDGVTGSAATATPGPAKVPGKPGQWSYSESRNEPDPDAQAATASVAAGDRVLRGAVYRVVRADGSVEYTNLPPSGQKGRSVTMLFTYISTCVACNLHSPIRWDSVKLNLYAYAETIRAASMEFGVDEAFLRAIIHAESAYNPRALSLKGAQGLMQLMPGTAGDMGVRDAFDADQNIRGGARYLAYLLRNFHGDERLAAAAYNAGAGAVQRYSGVPPYAETQVYVERVGTLRRRYGQAIGKPVAASDNGVAKG